MRLYAVVAGLLMWSLATANTTPPKRPSLEPMPPHRQSLEAALASSEQPADIRLLIDVSGSMRHTDPDNLRRPALSLLARLMPQDGAAGVWTFGQDVEPLVPHGLADADWKARALERMPGIDSRALYTNIGAALERATQDRDKPQAMTSSEVSRPVDIILLTDGKVDVSPDQQVSAREQSRVLNQLVPELSAAGYRIHTLALSEQADEPLLRALAQASDGLFSRARNADDLMDSLLGIFQQMVPGQRLPLDGGRFFVDDSIEEFTLLVRRDADQAPARLRGPNDQAYEHTDSRPNLSWHHTERYDLLTLVGPDSGWWTLQAEPQPHNRLTVISDLQLRVAPLPNNLVVGQPLSLTFALHDRHGRIEDPALLSVMTLEAQFAGPGEREQKRRRWRGEPPAEGRYRMTLPAPREPGEYRLELRLDGKTFQRFFSHRMTVASVFTVELRKQKQDDQVHWGLQLEAIAPLDEAASRVVAHVRNSKGYTRLHTLSDDSSGAWSLRVTPEQPANYRIDLQASGRLRSGAAFNEALPTQYFNVPEEGDLVASPLDTAIAGLKTELTQGREAAQRARRGVDSSPSSGAPRALSEPRDERTPPQADEPVPNEAAHPILRYGSLTLANGLLLALAYFSYRRIMSANRRRTDSSTRQ